MEYAIFTDSGCDLPPKTLDEWRVVSLGLSFRLGSDGGEFKDGDVPYEDFYSRMRDGERIFTSTVAAGEFSEAFEKELSQGRDLLYLGFSSALSATFSSAYSALGELKRRYPERTALAIDTLSASLGLGFLVSIAKEKRDAGASIFENAAFIEAIKLKLCHWFTVDDLTYLKRGGRVSPSAAFIGNTLGIKPIMRMDDEGRLVKYSKSRGRRGAILTLAEKYGKGERGAGRAFISHADCPADAEALAEIISKEYGGRVDLISSVGSVIGAHSGPGTLALFFIGEER